jgi:hypothetical protein
MMPEYLPRYVPGVDATIWQTVCLQRAREAAEECVAISRELSKAGTLFSSQVLLARIIAADGSTDSALESLGAMLSAAEDKEQHAEL